MRDSLRWRIAAILAAGLFAAWGLSGWLVMREGGVHLSGAALTRWLLQALLLGIAVVIAVRLATRPLAALADAARRLGDDAAAPPLPEAGPSEVRAAAVAFNTMQRRLAEQAARHVEERVQMLAAVSHDLRTPITRMRMRCETLADAPLRDKLQADLAEMQRLVDEGLAYARSAQAQGEAERPVDVAALLDALVCDRADAGQVVAWQAPPPLVLSTRPAALKRIVDNLLDNALKFGEGEVELALDTSGPRAIVIAVRDRGPGIPPGQLATVMAPFVRLEASRNRDSGGTGLGLAIAQRLADAIGAQLALHNRAGGGLEARLVLQRQTSSA